MKLEKDVVDYCTFVTCLKQLTASIQQNLTVAEANYARFLSNNREIAYIDAAYDRNVTVFNLCLDQRPLLFFKLPPPQKTLEDVLFAIQQSRTNEITREVWDKFKDMGSLQWKKESSGLLDVEGNKSRAYGHITSKITNLKVMQERVNTLLTRLQSNS